MSADHEDLGPVIAHEIRRRDTHAVVQKIDVDPDRGPRYAEVVFQGLCNRVNFDEFYIDTIHAPVEPAGGSGGQPLSIGSPR